MTMEITMSKKKTKTPLEKHLEKYSWLWEDYTPLKAIKQKTR